MSLTADYNDHPHHRRSLWSRARRWLTAEDIRDRSLHNIAHIEHPEAPIYADLLAEMDPERVLERAS